MEGSTVWFPTQKAWRTKEVSKCPQSWFALPIAYRVIWEPGDIQAELGSESKTLANSPFQLSPMLGTFFSEFIRLLLKFLNVIIQSIWKQKDHLGKIKKEWVKIPRNRRSTEYTLITFPRAADLFWNASQRDVKRSVLSSEGPWTVILFKLFRMLSL